MSAAASGPPVVAIGRGVVTGIAVLSLMRLARAQHERYNGLEPLPIPRTSHMQSVRRLTRAGAVCLTVAAVLCMAAAPQTDKDRPKASLKATPMVSRAPSRVVLTAELTGGSNDYEDFYCPTVEWDWGDGTQSESTNDCAPYEAGKSEIKRRFTVEHRFQRPGAFRVTFKLKRHDKATGFASVSLQVRPGLRDPGQ